MSYDLHQVFSLIVKGANQEKMELLDDDVVFELNQESWLKFCVGLYCIEVGRDFLTSHLNVVHCYTSFITPLAA